MRTTQHRHQQKGAHAAAQNAPHSGSPWRAFPPSTSSRAAPLSRGTDCLLSPTAKKSKRPGTPSLTVCEPSTMTRVAWLRIVHFMECIPRMSARQACLAMPCQSCHARHSNHPLGLLPSDGALPRLLHQPLLSVLAAVPKGFRSFPQFERVAAPFSRWRCLHSKLVLIFVISKSRQLPFRAAKAAVFW